jgi:23S rRNA (adenine2503-C2)-methyltransferase
MRIENLRQQLRYLGAKTCHEQRVLRAWTQVRSLDTRHRRAEDFCRWRYVTRCLA